MPYQLKEKKLRMQGEIPADFGFNPVSPADAYETRESASPSYVQWVLVWEGGRGQRLFLHKGRL